VAGAAHAPSVFGVADVGQEVDDHVAEDVVLVAGDHVAGVGHVHEASTRCCSQELVGALFGRPRR
jgi:hypothetical protein